MHQRFAPILAIQAGMGWVSGSAQPSYMHDTIIQFNLIMQCGEYIMLKCCIVCCFILYIIVLLYVIVGYCILWNSIMLESMVTMESGVDNSE